MGEVIFETVHGSRLYGLAHADSDHDVFRVTTTPRRRARHGQRGGEDVCEVGICLFFERALSGSHQSVEALFSPLKVWHDERFRALIEGSRVCGSSVFEKYERTIRKFAFGDFKRRRHACRLAMNLAELRAHGRFNPVMSHDQVMQATAAADRYEGDALLAHLFDKEDDG